MKKKNRYENPLIERYAGKRMKFLFSPDYKFQTWRELWIALAEAQMELGLKITKKQINEMKKFKDKINYGVVKKFEKELRHDVMAHIKAYGKQCPSAAGIIHLGATSAYVGDNADILIINEAIDLIMAKLLKVIKALSKFSRKFKGLPTLGYTHYQPAQLTTVGKRAVLWLQDFINDFKFLLFVKKNLHFLGVKGATGSQDSFLDLFDGDEQKVMKLDKAVAQKMGIKNILVASSQTYPRKYDYLVLSALSSLAQSAHKFTNDIRLLQHDYELFEPFEKKQVGSSAMAYKRNPMRCERTASLSRFLIVLAQNAGITASTQWLERTLDDSANRRLILPQAFLSADSILILCENIVLGLEVNEQGINERLNKFYPQIITERILMEVVKNGGNRQAAHEKIRQCSIGENKQLISNLLQDPDFIKVKDVLIKFKNPKSLIGLSKKQVELYLKTEAIPIIRKYNNLLKKLNDADTVNV